MIESKAESITPRLPSEPKRKFLSPTAYSEINILPLLAILLLFPFGISPSLPAESPEYTIKIIYNNIEGNPDAGLTLAGGFSAWIEFDGKALLFDAGGEATILLNNMRRMNLDPSKLSAIIISHSILQTERQHRLTFSRP